MHRPMVSLFRETCGLSAPLAFEYRDTSQPEQSYSTRRFDTPFVLVGRDPRADLRLDDPQISPRHAFLQVIGGMVYCIDLDSRTKLIWDGSEHAREHGWMEYGRGIKMGPFELRWSAGLNERAIATELPNPLAVLYPEPEEAAHVSEAGLELPVRAGEYTWVWRLKGSLAVLGRSDSCQLTISDESVSKQHACLIRNRSGLWVVDLLSREGILVNDVKVRWAWLDLEDVVKIGRLSFKVWYNRRPEGMSRDAFPITAGAAPPSVPEDRAGTGPPVSSRPVPSQAAKLLATSSVPMPVPYPGPTALPDQLVLPPQELAWKPPGHFEPGLMSLWQRQMQVMESFHQDMILMVRMFFAMHQEQRAAVREEFSKVEQLTQELKELQCKLAEISKSQGNGHGANRNASAPSQTSMQEVTGTANNRADSVNPPGSSGGKMGQPANGSDETPAPSAAVSLPEDAAAAGREDQSVSIEHAELHQKLTNRINDLQRERQHYWQRILSTIKK